MSPLIRGNGNTLHIFLNSGIDNFLSRAVMAQMNNFCARALHDSPHDVNCGIMPIK